MADRKDSQRPEVDAETTGLDRPAGEVVREEIRAEILAIHRDSYGRGAGSVVVHVLDDLVVVLLDELELLPSEETLIDAGHGDLVAMVRHDFQQAIAPTFKAVVERATGRRVAGFTSQLQIEEPRFAVEMFRLETEG